MRIARGALTCLDKQMDVDSAHPVRYPGTMAFLRSGRWTLILEIRVWKHADAAEDVATDRILVPSCYIVDVSPEYRTIHQSDLLTVKQFLSVANRELTSIEAQAVYSDCVAAVEA